MVDFADFESENTKKDLSDMDVFAELSELAQDTDNAVLLTSSSSAPPAPGAAANAMSAGIRHIIDLALPQLIELRAKGKNVVFSELPDISKLQAESKEKIPRYLQSAGLIALEGKHSLTEPLNELQEGLPNFFNLFMKLLPDFNDEGRGLSYLTAISSASGEQHRFAYRKMVEASPDLIRSGRLDDDEKLNYKLRKHASALCEHIESTLGLLDTINGNLPHFLPWAEVEESELKVLRDIMFVTENKYNTRDKLDAFGKLNEQDKKNMMVADPEFAALLKTNSVMNFAGWDERRDRQKLVPEVNKSATQLRTSIKLTRGSAQNLVKKIGDSKESKADMYFLANSILAVCKPLEKLADVLEGQSKSALPSEKMLQEYGDDTNPQYINREVTNFKEWKENPFPKMITLPLKKVDTSINSLIHKAKDTISKEGIPGAETAVFRVGIILSYRLQQLARNIAIMKRDSTLLQMAMERKAVTEKLPKSLLFTTKLDIPLEGLSEDWQKKIEQQRDALQTSLNRMALLADEDKRPIFLGELRDILREAPDDPTSREVISKFDAFTVECVNGIGKVEKALVSQVTDILTAPEKRKAGLQVGLAKWQADLDGLQHSLETGLKRYTGRSLNNFSRGAMIAKGLAVRLQKNKQAYLKTVGEAERGEAGTQYDTLVHSIMEEEYLPLFAKENDVKGELFLQRFELEMKNAEGGNIIYPTTMAEILSGMKSTDQSIREWAKKQLVMRGVFRHIIRGVSLIPQALSIPVSLGYRIAMRGGTIAVMYVMVKYRGEQGIRLGQGGIGHARNTWLRETLKVGALKTLISSVPGLPLLAGLDTIRLEIEDGGDPVDILLDSGKTAIKALPMQGLNELRRDVEGAWQEGRARRAMMELLKQPRAPATDPGKERLSTVSARDTLERIAESKNPALADSAKRLQAISRRKAFPVSIQESSHQTVSSFDLETQTITLRKGATDEEKLHEIAHALSAYLVRIGQEKEELDSPLGKTVKELDNLRQRALESYRKLHGGKDDKVLHHLKNLDEFIAGLYSGDSEFRSFLHSIDAQRSLLVRFVALLCELLMLDTERENTLRHALELSETIMGHSLSDYEMRRYEGTLYYGGSSLRQNSRMHQENESRSAPRIEPTTRSAIDWQTFNDNKISDSSDEDSVSIPTELEEEGQQAREEQSDPFVGAGKVSDYFLKKGNVSKDVRQDTLVWTTITGSDIDPDERNEAYNAFVYLWQPGKPGRIKLTVGQYLNDDDYLNSQYQMMLLPRDYLFADENSTPTEDDRRWSVLEGLYRSGHIRQLHQSIFAETSDADEAAISQEESEPAVEEKTHTEGTKSWETDNQQCFPLQGERDLVAGEKILVSVTDEQGLVEYIEIIVPATELGRHRWPAYVAATINSEMKFVRVGDQGQSASIDVKTDGENYLWATNGQVVEWQIIREGGAAGLPVEDNAQWRVPASDTWATTPPRLAFPRPASADERLVIWVEDKKSGALIERLEVPELQEPNEKNLSQEINKHASHLRVGELSEGDIAPTDDAGGNIFWVDNDDYVVKYALVPAESLDKKLQLQQRYQLLDQLQRNPTETRAFMASGKHHPYTALDRTEINTLLAMTSSSLRDDVARLFGELREAGLSPREVMDSERWSDSEKTLINDNLSFRTRQPLLASTAENKSFAKAKTDALRYFLFKYPNLAEGTHISATTVDQHQLLAAVNDVYAKMTPSQQNDFIFVTALNWKLAADASFSSRITSLTAGTTLELFGLREEVITDYETAVSKEFFVNAESKTADFKSRSESSSDEAYFKQFVDYIKDNLSDEAKRLSRLQIIQSGLSSFDMNRPVAKSVKITMSVPFYHTWGLNRRLREAPATGDIHLFKTDSGRYFIYSSVGESVFLQEVKDNFSETELTEILGGTINKTVKIKLEELFRKMIPLDDVSMQQGFGSYNSNKWSADGPSTYLYGFKAQVESPQELQSMLATANSAYLNRAVAQYREQQFTLSNWEKFRDATIPFYKLWSRSSIDPLYEHSDEDSFNDMMNLFGLFSVVAGGGSGLGKAAKSFARVLRSGRSANASTMLLLLARATQATAPGLKKALRGMAVELASEIFPPLDLIRAARKVGGHVHRATGSTGGDSGLWNIAEGSSQSVASRNPFNAQNSVSVDLSDAARYQPSGHNSVNAPNNLYIKDGQIYLQRSDGVFELDATHGGRTLRVRVPGQTPHTGPEIIHTSNGFIAKGPSGLGGGKSGGSRTPLGDNRGQPIRGTLGRERYGQDNLLSKPRTDLTPAGTWPGTRPTLSEVYDETKALDNHRNYKSLNAETKVNTKVVTDKIYDIFEDYVTKNPIPLDAAGKPKFSVSAIGFGSVARKELLLVSDIDLQLIVVASDAHVVEARAYAKAMLDNVKSEWSKVRSSVSISPDNATALKVDSIGGGVIVVDSAEKAAGLMKPTKLGGKGYMDTYADSRAIYESKPGTYEAMFEGYEAKLQNSEVNGLVNDALSDLGTLPPTLISAKQTFIRPITLAVGGLYRKLRAKLGTKLPYETNTLKRAQILREYELIDDATYQNIEEVLLRSFKWEQEAGLESFKHGQQVLPKRASSSRTRGMYNKTRQIKQSLASANDKINRMPAPITPDNGFIAKGPSGLGGGKNGGSPLRERNAGVTTLTPMEQPEAVSQTYVRSQWQAGTSQPRPVGNINIQVDRNGPWRLAYASDDKAETLTIFSHGKRFSSKPTTPVPDGIEIELATPHDTAATLPGESSFMHDEITPFATVNKKKFKISAYKDPQKTVPVPLSELRDKILGPGKKPKVSDDEQRVLATGTDKKGSVINYVNLPFNPDKGTGNYVESDFIRFVEKNRVAQDSSNHAVIKQVLNIPDSQPFIPAAKTDFLFLDTNSSHGFTSQVLEIAKDKGYKKVKLLHCRVEQGKENTAVVYQINPHIPKEDGSLAGSDKQLYTVEFDLENDTMDIILMTRVSAVAKASELEETDSES
ncbi:hypothetical protein P8971_23705 [Serratia marcescens]|uniref:hypothetical protein n=1 Tax=Serratia marcescens TaxID=615 RepID=UPI003204F3E9